MKKNDSWEANSHWYFVLTCCLFLSILPRLMPNRLQHFRIWTTLAQCCIWIEQFFSLFDSRSGSRPPYCWGSESTLGRTPWMSDCAFADNCTWQTAALTRQTSMRPAGFEPAIQARERQQTCVSNRAATEIGRL